MKIIQDDFSKYRFQEIPIYCWSYIEKPKEFQPISQTTLEDYKDKT